MPHFPANTAPTRKGTNTPAARSADVGHPTRIQPRLKQPTLPAELLADADLQDSERQNGPESTAWLRRYSYTRMAELCAEAGIDHRQRTVLLLACRGFSERQIAHKLGMSWKKVGGLLDGAVRKLAERYPQDGGTTLREARQIARCFPNRSMKHDREPEPGQEEEWVFSSGPGLLKLTGKPFGMVASDLRSSPAYRSNSRYLLELAKDITQPLAVERPLVAVVDQTAPATPARLAVQSQIAARRKQRAKAQRRAITP